MCRTYGQWPALPQLSTLSKPNKPAGLLGSTNIYLGQEVFRPLGHTLFTQGFKSNLQLFTNNIIIINHIYQVYITSSQVTSPQYFINQGNLIYPITSNIHYSALLLFQEQGLLINQLYRARLLPGAA